MGKGKATDDAMRSYMQDIGQYPLLSREEETILGYRSRDGDLDARDELIKRNLRLVVKIAHDFKGMGLPMPDLISEGNIGLMKAAEKYDPDKGAKFSSYGSWWIKQGMRRAIFEKSRIIRIPVASANKIRKIKRAKGILTREHGEVPSYEMLASYLGEHENLDVSPGVIRRLDTAITEPVRSLHDPLEQGSEFSLEEIVAADVDNPSEQLSDENIIDVMNECFFLLDEREQEVLRMRYGLDGTIPKTLEEVSRTIGRTRERVRQIQKKALGKMKTYIEDPAFYLRDNIEEERKEREALELHLHRERLNRDGINIPYDDA